LREKYKILIFDFTNYEFIDEREKEKKEEDNKNSICQKIIFK